MFSEIHIETRFSESISMKPSVKHISFFVFLVWSFPALHSETSPLASDSLYLEIVYPTNKDTIRSERIRYAGSVNSGAEVTVQGDETTVYASGAFVGLVELEGGWNAIAFEARMTNSTVRDTVWIFRERMAYQEIPTAVDMSRIKPAGSVYIFPGDELEVEFWGSPGGIASFSIDDIADNLRMREISPQTTGEGAGLYRGSVRIPDLDNHRSVPVRFRLKGKDGRTAKFDSPGLVRVLPANLEIFGITSDSVNIVRREMDGRIWLQLPPKIKMKITGVFNGYKKVELAPGVTGYIESSSLKALRVDQPYPKVEIGEVSVVEFGEWVQIQFPLTEKVPFEIRQYLNPQTLEVVFYHIRNGLPGIRNRQLGEVIQSLEWQQDENDVVSVRVHLNQSQQWGFWGNYLGSQFWLNIRKRPSLSEPALGGIRITLDPGHGGAGEGAISPTGLTEKNINLSLAKKVARSLQLAGANVSMTRSQDSTVTLESRVAFARKNRAHIFVSLHHNSIAPDKDPLRPKGAAVYYYTPQSQEVAGFVYRNLLGLNLAPFGLRSSDYFVTRQTDMLAFLIEGAFLTHPEDELLLLDDAFLDKMAQAISDGIREFVLSTKSAPIHSSPNSFDTGRPAGSGASVR